MELETDAAGVDGRHSVAGVFRRPSGAILFSFAETVLGQNVNKAEELAILIGVVYAEILGVRSLRVLTDSRIAARRAQFAWRCASRKLPALTPDEYVLASAMEDYEYVDVCWIPRRLNRSAHILSGMHYRNVNWRI